MSPSIMDNGVLRTISAAEFDEIVERNKAQKFNADDFEMPANSPAVEFKTVPLAQVMKADGITYGLNRAQLVTLCRERGIKHSPKADVKRLKKLLDKQDDGL